MLGPVIRMIKSRGNSYDVYNSAGGGGRSTPDYGNDPDGTITGVLESRGMPQTATDSDGTEVETDLEIRSVPDGEITLRPAGDADGYPSLLEHPNGTRYRLLGKHQEDGGVTVLTVIRR